MSTSFTPDARFERTLDTLKEHYGATSKAEIIRKAVTLLSIISEHESKDGSITLRLDDNHSIRIIVR